MSVLELALDDLLAGIGLAPADPTPSSQCFHAYVIFFLPDPY